MRVGDDSLVIGILEYLQVTFRKVFLLLFIKGKQWFVQELQIQIMHESKHFTEADDTIRFLYT